jgi:HSP20 family molecular chaperone IbpA
MIFCKTGIRRVRVMQGEKKPMARDPMARDVARDWMWSEACEMLARAERMHRELFRPAGTQARLPAWEPPVDILETEYEVLVLVALPGVDVDSAQAVIEDGDLVIAGTRALPGELRTAVIHRLELPQGRFYRRLPLPAGRYSNVRRAVSSGCLVIALEKANSRG